VVGNKHCRVLSVRPPVYRHGFAQWMSRQIRECLERAKYDLVCEESFKCVTEVARKDYRLAHGRTELIQGWERRFASGPLRFWLHIWPNSAGPSL